MLHRKHPLLKIRVQQKGVLFLTRSTSYNHIIHELVERTWSSVLTSCIIKLGVTCNLYKIHE